MDIIRDYRDKILAEKAVKAAEKTIEVKEEKQIEQLQQKQQNYNLYVHSIDNDCKRISSLPRGDARRKLKKNEIIPQYQKYIDSYLQGDEVYKNPVLVQVMIWLFDIGDIAQALKIAHICILQKQPMPKRFKRNLHSFIADAVLEWCKVREAHSKTIQPHFANMFAKVQSWPVHDIIKMHYLKKAGWAAYVAEDNQAAFKHFTAAKKMAPYAAKVETILAKLKGRGAAEE